MLAQSGNPSRIAFFRVSLFAYRFSHIAFSGNPSRIASRIAFFAYRFLWLEWHGEQKESALGRTDYWEMKGPERLMVVNLCAIRCYRKEGKDLDEINRKVQTLCEQLRIRSLPSLELRKVSRWNWTTSESREALFELPVFDDWGDAVELSCMSHGKSEVKRLAVSTAIDWWYRPTQNAASQWFNDFLEFIKSLNHR